MISFPRAPRVAPGEAVTSTQLADLANAFNARLRSGLGDPTWRIAYYILSMLRQVRNPDSSGWLWPSNAEALEVYAMLDWDVADWPVMGPGEPEGVNLASPLPAYVFGNEQFGLYDEASRLSDPLYGGLLLDPGVSGSEARRMWDLGKMQRGAWDPATGGWGSPSFSAARSFARVQYSRFSPHGNGYGGWLPTPGLMPGPGCDDPDPTDEYAAPINYEIKFTALVAGLSDKTYPGTCQPIPPEAYPAIYPEGLPNAGHVAGIVYTPWAYYVYTNPAVLGDPYVVEELSTSDYIEGPYTGMPKLSKTPGDHFMRIMDRFVRDFRGAWGSQVPMPDAGAPPAGAPPRDWLSGAFDFHRFLTSQYPLAPARGVEQGGTVLALYASAQVGSHRFDGTDGCVFAGCFASGGPGTYEIVDDLGQVVDTFSLTVSEPEVVRWFGSTPAAGSGVTVRCTSGSTATVEMAELMEYKPQLWDLFLVLRLSGLRVDS